DPVFYDLCSIDPAVRAAAATKIREGKMYRITDDAPWIRLKAKLKKGMPLEDLLTLLREAKAFDAPEPGRHFPESASFGFQLEESWILTVYYKIRILQEWKLVEAPQQIWVVPPPDYTGTWMIYRLDGTAMRAYASKGEFGPT